jgi:hypothetical protein
MNTLVLLVTAIQAVTIGFYNGHVNLNGPIPANTQIGIHYDLAHSKCLSNSNPIDIASTTIALRYSFNGEADKDLHLGMGDSVQKALTGFIPSSDVKTGKLYFEIRCIKPDTTTLEPGSDLKYFFNVLPQ